MSKWTDEMIGRALLKLWKEQPQAQNIRLEDCHCRTRGVMMSYQLPGDGPDPRDPGHEAVGFFCGTCFWGNGGHRGIAVSFDDIERFMVEAQEGDDDGENT